MSQYQPLSINTLLSSLSILEREKAAIVLPALQRDFVWSQDKICSLFDSLLKGFPVGTFLFWKIGDNHDNMVFNYFISDVTADPNNKGHVPLRGEKCKKLVPEAQAVLDGQQRITAINIGLNGSWKCRPKGSKPDTEPVECVLCLNIRSLPQDDDEDYELEFIPRDKTGIQSGGEKIWVPLSHVMSSDGFNSKKIEQDLKECGENDQKINDIIKRISRFQTVLYDNSMAFYSAEHKNLSEAYEIFKRLNTSGQILTESDIFLSAASSKFKNDDLYLKVHQTVEDIRKNAGKETVADLVDRDLFLASGLYVTQKERVTFKKALDLPDEELKKIFSKDGLEKISKAFCTALLLLKAIGYTKPSAFRKNVLQPIVLYFYLNPVSKNYFKADSKRYASDCLYINEFLLGVSLNSVLVDGTGSTLRVIKEAMLSVEKMTAFPLKEISDRLDRTARRSIRITGETINDILSLKFSDPKVEPVMKFLLSSPGKLGMKHLHTSNARVQIDHIWAKASVRNYVEDKVKNKLMTLKEKKEWLEMANSLPNFELLYPVANKNKAAEPFGEWYESTFTTDEEKTMFRNSNLIPEPDADADGKYDIKDFKKFYEKRKKLLKKRIKESFCDLIE